jgi:DNA-binding transcriptional regulator GbsR (MarR family)
MANTITFEITNNQVKNVEKIIDKTLTVLRRMEEESPEREKRIAQSKAETQAIKKEIRKQLAILDERNKRLDAAWE